MKGFEGTVAIITGGASGIGKAIGSALVDHGATVVLADIDEALAEETAAALGDRASAAPLDVRDAEAVQSLVTRVAEEHGRLDYMFNNAGILIIGEATDLFLDDWNRTLDVNLRGVVNGIVAAYPLMVAQGYGHIVNTASVAGLVPSPGLAPYAASKHAVVGLSTSLRAEAARHGVKVNVFCPGVIRTPMLENADFSNLNVDREESIKRLWAFATSPEDCARAVLRGIVKNQPVTVVAGHAKVMSRLHRFMPRVGHWLAPRLTKRFRER